MKHQWIRIGNYIINMEDVSMIGVDETILFAIMKSHPEKVDLEVFEHKSDVELYLNRLCDQMEIQIK